MFYYLKKLKAILKLFFPYKRRAAFYNFVLFVRKFVQILNPVSAITKSKEKWKLKFFHNFSDNKIWPALTYSYLYSLYTN